MRCAAEARTWGVLIDGPGGIGKTALAVRAAYLAPTTHYPYKIFLSAKVRELTPAGRGAAAGRLYAPELHGLAE